MSKLAFTPTPFVEAYPAPWRIQGLEIVDRDGCHVQDFESDTPDDLEFWQGIVSAVNAAAQAQTAGAFHDGVRATYTLFFIDSASGIETEVAAKHLRSPLVDIAFFVDSSKTILSRMMPQSDWRLMTEEEVNAYLDRQAEELSDGYAVEEAR